MSNFEDVKKFMKTFGQKVITKPQFPDEKTMNLRFDLIKEEVKKTYIYHDRSAINTVESDIVNLKKNKPKTIIEKKSITLNKIIENSPFNNKKINLLTIDVEGHEFPVLENFEFSKYKIDVVVIELLDKKIKKMEMWTQSIDMVLNSNIYNLLLKRGYKLINWIHSDLIFINNNFNGGIKNE